MELETALLPKAATGTGAGTANENQNLTRAKNIGCSIVFTGSITVLVVAIEGDINGQGFFPIVTHTFTAAQITAKLAGFGFVNIPSSKLRYNITTLTGSGTVTTSIVDGDNRG